MTTSKPFLSNTAYDRLKWVALVGLPALGALYFALSPLWGLPKATEVVGTIVAVDTFLGLLLGLANKKYQANQELDEVKYDGVMNIVTTPDSKTFQLELHDDPEPLEHKDSVVFKVVPTKEP